MTGVDQLDKERPRTKEWIVMLLRQGSCPYDCEPSELMPSFLGGPAAYQPY
jgi:hypothetical protein